MGRAKHVDMVVWGGGVFEAEEAARVKALRVGSGHEESEKQQVGQGIRDRIRGIARVHSFRALSVEILTFILMRWEATGEV